MAIEEILASLDVQADARVKEILDEANSQAEAIRAETIKQAQKTGDTYVAEAVEEKNLDAVRNLNAEAAAHRRALADLRREVYDEVFSQAAEKIKGIRNTPEYPAILARLVEEATGDMTEGYVLHVDPADKDLVADVCRGVACAADIQTMGGVVVTSVDGRIRRSSTFEDRLQLIREKYVELVSKVLNK